jgi:putative heme iron utilization protein
VLSTIASGSGAAGYPVGSLVEYAADDRGQPVFALSTLSAHLKDLQKDPRCSLTVAATTFQVFVGWGPQV